MSNHKRREGGRWNCRRCEELAKELGQAVAEVYRASDREAQKAAERRCAALLAMKASHEKRTGHRVLD